MVGWYGGGVSVTAADLLRALDGVPARAAEIAQRRAEIERQNAEWDDLVSRALRRSVSGLCFDLGDDNYVRWESVNGGPTPRDSSILFMAYVLPTDEWSVEDYHGGWALSKGTASG